MKDLIREIVLTEAYQRASASNGANEKVDGANRYWWRQNRRRLDAELLSDAMLSVSGELDPKLGGPSSALTDAFGRRTLYAKTSRFQPNETLSLFDLPSASVTCEQRVVTNVPLQKLYFLNSDSLAKRSQALSKRVARRNRRAGIAHAYQLLLDRAPSAQEEKLGLAFLKQSGKDRWVLYSQVLLSSNEFAYVD
jgi:hypothetical protein